MNSAASIRIARRDHLPMSAALPVLLKSCDCRVRFAVASAKRMSAAENKRVHCAKDSAHYNKQ